jgi:glucosyl-3-phosphoglycerate synthase
MQGSDAPRRPSADRAPAPDGVQPRAASSDRRPPARGEAPLGRIHAGGPSPVRHPDADAPGAWPDGPGLRPAPVDPEAGVDAAVETWRATRRHHHAEFPVQRLARIVGATRVTAVLPAREVADTIGAVLDRTVAPLVRAGVVHEVLVVDSASVDGTAAVARAHGATVLQEDDLRPDAGPCRGKGDAMWRALHVATGDVVAFLDADTSDPQVAHLAGTIGPLLVDPGVHMVRGTFDRPRRAADGSVEPHGGGRVTELTARPLLNLHVPLLAGFLQPLAGEFAGRRELLRDLPFPTGYGVEIATLIDALHAVGLQGLAECDLGVRQNRHQPLRDLSRMAYAVLCAVERRIDRGVPAAGTMRLPWDDAPRSVPVDERAPVAAWAADAALGAGPAADVA